MNVKKKWIMSLWVIILMFVMSVPSMAASPAKLSQKSMSLYEGEAKTLKVKGKKKKVKWSSSNSYVATVNSKGKVKGKHTGTAVITAKVSKKKLKCKVTVKTLPDQFKKVYQVDMEIFAKKTQGGMWGIDTDKTDEYLVDNYGKKYQHSFYAGKGTVTYLTNYKYKMFSGTVACPKGLQPDEWKPYIDLYIYGDGKKIASFPAMNCYSRPMPFSLDISNYERITLEWKYQEKKEEIVNIWKDWGYYATIFDGVFTKK